MASAREGNNQTAIGGSRRQKEKSRRGNRVSRANRKIAVSNRGIAPSNRNITVRQSGNRAGLFKNRGAAIGGSRRPLEKLQRGNQGIAPASSKIAAQQ
jgi:hypothetical protein